MSFKDRMETGFYVFGAIALLAGGLVVWRVSQLPLQPAHMVTAHVEEIWPPQGRLYNRDRIYLRNDRGFGVFSLEAPSDRCHVGQEVRVQQRGTALTPLPSTCR